MNQRVAHIKTERLTPEQKLELVRGLNRATNAVAYAKKVGYDRSYLYQLRRELEEAALQGWAQAAPGRPPLATQPTAAELEQLQNENAELLGKAQAWEAQAVLATWVLDNVVAPEVVKKNSSPMPIFWRD